MGGLDSAVTRVDSIFARFRAIYPQGRQPGVYFVVGAGMAAGTTTHTSDPVVLIGVERAGDPSRLASTVAHEFVHTQQDYPWIGIFTGGPSFLRGTLLRQSIMEGSANLIAELVTGVPSRDEYAEAHEAELWADFSREMHGKDYSRWLWNGSNPKRGDRPADLGYWIGYRITKAYYDRCRRQSARHPRYSDHPGFRSLSYCKRILGTGTSLNCFDAEDAEDAETQRTAARSSPSPNEPGSLGLPLGNPLSPGEPRRAARRSLPSGSQQKNPARCAKSLDLRGCPLRLRVLCVLCVESVAVAVAVAVARPPRQDARNPRYSDHPGFRSFS